MPPMDHSKGQQLHRLYGHFPFALQARKDGKSTTFIETICQNLKCTDYKDGVISDIQIPVSRNPLRRGR